MHITKEGIKRTAGSVWSKLWKFGFCLIFIQLISLLFGQENTLIGVALATALLMFLDLDLGIRPGQAVWIAGGLFPALGLLSLAAQYNVWLGLGINIAAIFLSMLLTSAPLASKAYLPFLLCYIFIQGTPVYGWNAVLRIVGLTFGGAVVAGVYWLRHRRRPQKRSVEMLLQELPRLSLRMDFIWRITVGVSLAMLLGELLHAPKPMWISIVVMSLTQPFQADTRKRIIQRVGATMVGVVLFLLLFEYLVPQEYTVYLVLLLGVTYSFIEEYKVQQVFITINALSAAMVLYRSTVSIPMRVGFLLLGVAIVMVVDWLDHHVLRQLLEKRGERKEEEESPLSQNG